MTKAILLSVRPEHALNILKKTKTLELRKHIPKNFKGWVYVYVTKGKRLSVVHDDEIVKTYYYLNSYWGRSLNQDIPFRFWFDEYDDIIYKENEYIWCNGKTLSVESIGSFYLNQLKLSYEQIHIYGKGKDLYAWHIKKLDIFNKPMQLSDFVSDKLVIDVCGSEFKCYSETASYFARKDQRLTKAPQSYQYVWVKE